MALPLSYNLRNLAVRRLSTSLTFLVVAVVVFVLSVLLSFATGISKSLSVSGVASNLIVLAPGATAESTSIISLENVSRLVQTPGVKKDESGAPIVSREICVQTSIPRRNADGNLANVAVRGVDLLAFDVHTDVHLTVGRRFEEGALEVVVGQAAQARYANLNLGDKLHLGKLANRIFTVVGIFEAGGGALESEIWAPRSVIASAYDRQIVSSVVLPFDDPNEIPKAIEYVRSPSVALEAKSEDVYYEELMTKTRDIVILAVVLVGLMSIGAVFAVANTMYAAVDGRRREIAMLRTIGFTRRMVVTSFVMESLMICMSACIVGLACGAMTGGAKEDFLSEATWTVLAYERTITPVILVTAFAVSMAVGLGGAMAPAWRASRTKIIEALRKT